MNKPIGVFDSGLGGLSVLRSLIASYPKENFIYLGDLARLPYGNKSREIINKYFQRNLEYLLKYDIKALVVACNSASSAIIDPPVSAPIPVFNVIEPGSQAALRATQSHRIGVIATQATISQNAYEKCLKNINPSVEVINQACPLFVPLVEQGWIDDPLTNLVIHRYLTPVLEQDIDTLILGCTHFPFLKDSIRKVTGNKIALVDSADAVCEMLMHAMSLKKLEANEDNPNPFLKILTTDYSYTFEEMTQKTIPEFNIKHIEKVDI